jgi:spore germination cell wall hydrolase CwlJ-like protein
MNYLMKALNFVALVFAGCIITTTFNLTDVSKAAINIDETNNKTILPLKNEYFDINKFKKEEFDYVEPIVPRTITPIQIECLTRNLYFEARGEGEEGMKAVAYTTLNRVFSNLYPTSICGVVYQGERGKDGSLKYNRCQFSWTCDGTVKKIRHPELYNKAKAVAEEVAYNYSKEYDPTKGSLFYHATYLQRPFKKMNVVATVTIGNHIFYRKRNT